MSQKVYYEDKELGFVNIDDTETSGVKTYSSSKIASLLAAKQDSLDIDGTPSSSNPVATKSTLNSSLANYQKRPVLTHSGNRAIDFNNLTEDAIYYEGTTTYAVANAPYYSLVGGNYFGGTFNVVDVHKTDSDNIIQTCEVIGGASNLRKKWRRVKTAGTWSDWVIIPTQTEVDTTVNSALVSCERRLIYRYLWNGKSKQTATIDLSARQEALIIISNQIDSGGTFGCIALYSQGNSSSNSTLAILSRPNGETGGYGIVCSINGTTLTVGNGDYGSVVTVTVLYWVN